MGTHGQGAALLFLQHTKRSSAADFQFSITACLERALPEVSQKKNIATERTDAAQLNSRRQEISIWFPDCPSQPHKVWAMVLKGFSGTAWSCSQQPINHHTASQHWVAKARSPKDKENLAGWEKASTCSDPPGSYPGKQQTPPCCPSACPFHSHLLHIHIAPRTFHLPAGGHICFLPLMTILSLCFTENEEPLLPEACF